MPPPAVSLVVVCVCAPVFVHMTTSPCFAFTLFGLNAKSTIETFTVAANAAVWPTSARQAARPTPANPLRTERSSMQALLSFEIRPQHYARGAVGDSRWSTKPTG